MLTYQDFLQSDNKGDFILQAIEDFTSSDFYDKATDARSYYNSENTTILKRKPMFYGSNEQLREDMFKANNRICNEMYPKIVKQLNSYLLSNGVTTDETIKKGLGQFFDVKLQEGGIGSQVEGVSWFYCYIDGSSKFQVQIFRGTEIVPLYDERTGQVLAVIRFWQLDENKPMYVEFYEMDGKTEYIKNDDELMVTAEKTSYRLKRVKDAFSNGIVQDGNYSVLPVFPLYCNDKHKSSFTTGIKTKLDLYDIIMSDFGNNLEDSKDVYWVLKNYSGQDIGEFLADYKYYKTIKVDDDGDAKSETIDIPYQAREVALNKLREDIYEDAMALDTNALAKGALTATAIKVNMENLSLKADDFENEVYRLLYNVINLYEEMFNINKDYEIELIRRTLVNDSETIDNIYKMRSDISLETALELNPLIKDAKREMDRLESESLSKVSIIEAKV